MQQLEQKQLDLATEQQRFRQELDRERFDADEAYRTKALKQAERLRQKQLEIDWERLGLDEKRLTIDKQLSLLNLDVGSRQRKRAAIYNAITAAEHLSCRRKEGRSWR